MLNIVNARKETAARRHAREAGMEYEDVPSIERGRTWACHERELSTICIDSPTSVDSQKLQTPTMRLNVSNSFAASLHEEDDLLEQGSSLKRLCCARKCASVEGWLAEQMRVWLVGFKNICCCRAKQRRRVKQDMCDCPRSY